MAQTAGGGGDRDGEDFRFIRRHAGHDKADAWQVMHKNAGASQQSGNGGAIPARRKTVFVQRRQRGHIVPCEIEEIHIVLPPGSFASGARK